MSRRTRAVKRPIIPDPVYGSEMVTKFVNTLMLDGKKSTAEGIFYDAMKVMEERTGQPAETVFKTALNNAKPVLEVKSRRVGGATYQVPMEVPPARQMALAMRWIVGYAQARKNVPLMKALANELKEAAAGQGSAIKKKDDTHRMAEANKAFAHYRW